MSWSKVICYFLATSAERVQSNMVIVGIVRMSAAVSTKGNVMEEDNNPLRYMEIFLFLCFLTCL